MTGARKCRLFHRWKTVGMAGLFEIAERCDRCGWWKVTNVPFGPKRMYPPTSTEVVNDD